MGLLEKCIAYRERFLKEHQIGAVPGLLKRTLLFITPKNDTLDKTPEIKEDYRESNRTATAILPKIQVREEKKYYKTIFDISNDLSNLVVSEDSFEDFNRIIAVNFNFSKNALLIYSPEEQKFVFCAGRGLNDDSQKRLTLEIEYKDIYRRMVKDSFILSTPEEYDELLSNKDQNDSDFKLFTPFIFSGHVIGIFLGFKLTTNEQPDNEMIDALKLICRLNGALLYNIFQQQSLLTEKKKLKKNDEVLDNSALIKSIEKSDIDIAEYFEEHLHKLILFTRDKIKNSPESLLTVIHYKISINADINLNDFKNDIQFIIMNIIGTRGFVEIFKNMDTYIILPDVDKNTADITTEQIKREITRMFNEIIDDSEVVIKEKIVSYPEDTMNFIEIFFKARAL